VTSFAPLLRRVVAREDLSEDEAAGFIGEIMDGGYTPVQAAALLAALASKGETPAEIAGAARAMRERSLHVEHDLPMVVDVVGTGGDHANTINISTMAALVVAASGTPVAKHGNRAASSACGSADLLEAAGLPLEIAPERAAAMLRQCGFTFMFAPNYHPAVVGVAHESLVPIVGRALRALGVRRGAVVHGRSGVDEVVGDAPTLVYSFDENGERLWELDPSACGVAAPLVTPLGGTVAACREAFAEILGGARSSASDVVALNAAVVFYVTGAHAQLRDAFEHARGILHDGEAWRTFERARAMARG